MPADGTDNRPPAPMFPTKKSFLNYCRHQGGGSPRRDLVQQFIDGLRQQEQHDATEGRYFWKLSPTGLPSDQPLDVGVCTNSARIIARRFGGALLGYAASDNPSALIGPHDFALCGTLVVDYWAHFYKQVSNVPVLDLSDVVQRHAALKLYGNPERWRLVEPMLAFQPDQADLQKAVQAGYDWYGRPTRTIREILICMFRSGGMDYIEAHGAAIRAIAKMNKGFNQFTYGRFTLTVTKHG